MHTNMAKVNAALQSAYSVIALGLYRIPDIALRVGDLLGISGIVRMTIFLLGLLLGLGLATQPALSVGILIALIAARVVRIFDCIAEKYPDAPEDNHGNN